jgi:hypothetical protein
MARSLLPVFFAAACAAVTGCHNTTAGPAVNVAVSVAPQPPRVGAATVTVKLADPSVGPLTGARISIEGDMSHPGMEPVFAKASEVEPGSYVAHLQLAMPGDWVILVQGRLADGRKIERQTDLKGVLPG